jgi:hypothetical protein
MFFPYSHSIFRGVKNFLEAQNGSLNGQSEWEGEGRQKGKAKPKTLNEGQYQQSHLLVSNTNNTLLDCNFNNDSAKSHSGFLVVLTCT